MKQESVTTDSARVRCRRSLGGSMRATRVTALAVTALAAAGLATASAAGAAEPTDHLSGADVRFMDANTQTDLAEITLAGIVLSRTDDPAATDLAMMTMSDHQKALDEVRSIAGDYDVTLPTAPNAMQQATADQLMTVPADQLPVAYFTAQIPGHLKSISQTHHEIDHGSASAVTDYASSYLPVATMHLQMSRQDLRHATR
jgi:putative membrane protein